MSNYPYTLDTILTLPTVSGIDGYSVAINALQEAVLAIEEELGIKPSTPYSDARVRMDILESRINFGVAPSIPNDGYVRSPLYILNEFFEVTLSISDGYGEPTEDRIDGSIYMRAVDGYANNDLYIRRDGYWVAVPTEMFVAAGDLTGNHLSQKVVAIRTQPLDVSLETIGATEDGYHLTWDDTDAYWRAETGFIADGDLAILSGPFGRTGQTVIKLQGKNVSSIAPTDGYTLVWVAADAQWEPQTRAILFDGYTTRRNLISNKLLQSPIDNTKTGVINFGSRSAGSTAGATNDYAAILSGDRHTVSGNFGVVIGGDSHTASAQYSLVGDGYTNTASGQYSSVLNGTVNIANQTYSFVSNGNTNTSSGIYSFILDGYNNVASGLNSFILNGNNNAPAASYSSVLNGLLNTISSTSTHAAVCFGSSNTITGATATYSVIIGGSGNTTSAQNVLIGTSTGANVQSNYGHVGTGINNTISTSSAHSTIISGTTNAVAASSGFAFIGAGNNITVTGLYATVLNATTAVANGLHSLVLQGNTNSVTGSYSTIVNGNSNTISGAISYATILDGYSNTITGAGSLIGDGYSNAIAGLYSSILNGNNNIINAPNSSILNGSSNTIDVNSSNNAVMFGTANSLVGSTRVVVAGNGNTFTSVTNSYVLGQFNSVQGSSIKITGDSNTVGASSSFNRIFGNSNNLGATSVQNSVFGASNVLVNTTHDNVVLGSSNIVDGYGSSTTLGATNITSANFSFVQGQYGKSRLFGQQVHANSRFTAGKVGEAQWSRFILSGTGASGSAITLQLQDTAAVNATFQDGYSYDMQIRVLIVNTSPITPNPVLPARFVFDVLAHCESGTLTIDNTNQTLSTINIGSDVLRTAGWSVTIGSSGSQLTVVVDLEDPSSYVRPSNSPSNRRAVATVQMLEISRT